MATATPPNPALQALRIAAACLLCLILATWMRLEHANLAVWTTYIVMAIVPITVFQRGFERALGRGVGIVASVVLVSLFPDQELVRVLIGSGFLLAMFYGHLAGRLGYALINGGLYFSIVLEMARTQPDIVVHQAWEMMWAVLVGCLVSDVVVWATRGEGTLAIDTGTKPLFPLNNELLNHALLMIVTVFVTIRVCSYFELPLTSTIISVMLISGAADIHGMLLKGEMRLGGVALGGAFSVLSFLILSRVPYFAVLATLVFLGTFLAGYLSKVLGAYAYLGAQSGLVICLMLVVPPSEFGTLGNAVQRAEGALIAIFSVLIIPGLWPRFPFVAVTGSTATPPAGAGHG